MKKIDTLKIFGVLRLIVMIVLTSLTLVAMSYTSSIYGFITVLFIGVSLTLLVDITLESYL